MQPLELNEMSENWKRSWHPGYSEKDRQSVTADWEFVGQRIIEGVRLKEIRNVPKNSGMVTEVFRRDWFEEPIAIDQVFQILLQPRAISAWHAHEKTTDRLFVNNGLMLIVLYDGRPDTSTAKVVNEFRAGLYRPTLVTIPPKVWHGIVNISDLPSMVLNLVDHAYEYEDPDHWRLPWDTPEIPYRFPNVRDPALS